MKKIIALVLALMLAVTCFAACGKKDGDTKKKYLSLIHISEPTRP